jgi:aldose 1-epimerase
MRKRPFGRTGEGRAVEQVVLESGEAAVAILSLGAIVRDWRIDGPAGSLPMVLGFPTVEAYERHARSHGAICGRVANRIKDARFTLDGKEYLLEANEGPNQLHGGPRGLGSRVWDMEVDGSAIELRFASPDGDQGFPGRVDFAVRYWLEGPRLVCEMRGMPDRPTPINLANHSYYNLGGGGTVKDHVLRVDAEAYTPTDKDLIPLGEIREVEGTHLDFREPREIGDTRLDQNVVLREGRDVSKPAARVECPRTGVGLELWTAEPGLQLFDAPEMTIEAKGHDGQSYGPFAGLCLEAQHFPDSLRHPEWPSIVRSPEEPYFQRLEVAIGREVRDRKG